MATASKIVLTGREKPVFAAGPLSSDAAELASKLLQENHEKYHIFFRPDGFHNHLAHHVLTLYALNATPSQMRTNYTNNLSYQRAIGPINTALLTSLRDPSTHEETFASALAQEQNYATLLEFFKLAIAEKGHAAILTEFLFSPTPKATDLLARAFAGFLHPLIHLGFGVEFAQPAIIAEALAQAALHGDYLKPYFLACERRAAQRQAPAAKLLELLEATRADAKLAGAAHWDDGQKLRDGVLARASEEMIAIAARWGVESDDQRELDVKCAEMYSAAVYYTASSQSPSHVPKIDFFYMHAVNCSIFLPCFLAQPPSAISQAAKARLLNWKGWNDLALYASRGCPKLDAREIADYVPQHQQEKQGGGWGKLIERVNQVEDDGHSSKLIRALKAGEEVSWIAQEQGRSAIEPHAEGWWKVGNLAMDSVEGSGERWVRSTGFEEAWKGMPARL